MFVNLIITELYAFIGQFTEELPECTQDLMVDVTMSYYQHFKATPSSKTKERNK